MDVDVTVYWRPGCGFCSMLRHKLKRTDLTYREARHLVGSFRRRDRALVRERQRDGADRRDRPARLPRVRRTGQPVRTQGPGSCREPRR
ncbi:MAG: hypothetical protein V9E94_01050 [Microthrixaceae bacterium]